MLHGDRYKIKELILFLPVYLLTIAEKCKYKVDKYTLKYNRHTKSQQPNTMSGHLGEVDHYKDTSILGKF